MNIRIKSIWFGLLVTLFILIISGCSIGEDEDSIIPLEEENKETSIVPTNALAKENYRTILPFKPSEARGVIVNQVANRVDIDEVEQGLRRHSAEVFDPEEYFYEEGQYINESTLYDWLGRFPTEEALEAAVTKEINWLRANKMTVNEDKIRSDLQAGLNPPIKDDEDKKEHEENPRYLSHILEQNYLQRKSDDTGEVEIAGVSIALALKSVYRFQTEIGGDYYYEDIPKKTMIKEGEKIAQKVLERLRKIESLQNVPIMIALYREESQSSPIPGSFVAKTFIPENDMLISEWENINEENVLFPSGHAKEKYFEDYELVKSFGKDIDEYFPNYVGVVGEGFYINGELNKLTITVPIEFYGSGEVIGFTQYAYGIIKELFGNYYDLEIKVKSSDRMESLIYRKAGDEDPSVHIFN